MIKNLVQLLKERRMIKDKGLIFINEDGIEKNISYNDIFEIASKILYNLQFYGVKERDEVVFQIDDNEDYLCMFWACILGNIVPVPLPVKSNLEYKNRVYKIINMLNSPYLLADQEVLNQMKNDGDNIINKKVLDIINNKSFSTKDIKKLTGVGEISEGNDDDIAFIQFSSGSTGDPKGVMVTNKNIVCNITSLNRRTKTTDDDIIFSWLPLTHSMGLSMVHIAAYVQGINQYIMKPSTFIKKPLLWMQKVSEHKVTQLYSANFAYKYLIDAVKDQSNLKWDLSNVRYMMNASEIISSITCKEFGEVMKKYGLRDNVIHPGYGLSEATVAVTVEDAEKAFSSINIDRNNLLVGDKVQEVNEDDESCITLVDVGYPIDCCEIRICDSENNVLEENHIGHIQLKGESITKGYYNNLEATNSVYLENGWMDTGDLGFLRNKRLVVTGRFKDLIIINGVNYYPYDLERVAEDALDIGSGKIVSCGIFNKELQTDEAIMFVEYDKDIDGFIDIARNIKQHISKVMGLEINKIYPIDKIPKTVSGKVQRFILVNRYINEEFNDIKIEIDKAVLKKNIQYKSIELSKDNKIQPIIIDSILKISKEIIGEENIELSHCISAYAPSSIKIMQLTSRIENKHGVEISFKEFIEQETIFDIVNLVINKLNQKKENNEKNIYSQVKADTENKHEEFNLTDVQMAYLAGRDIKFELGGRSTHFYVEMDSELDIERFNLSFQKVINHHPMLRAIILESGQQKILENVPEYKIEVIDVTSKDQNKRELQFKQIRDEMSHHVFKTDKWPLFDIRAIKVGEYNYKVCMGFDMLIIDGSSFEILGKDLRKYYDDPEFQLEDVDFTFRDYISGYEKMKQTSRYENDRKYWLEKLKDFAVAPRLPLKVNPMNVKYPYYKRKCLVISKEIWNKIKKKADDKKIRHSALLCSIYAWVLSYWSNQERMAINMTLFNRYPFHESINELIGDFTSVMLVDVNVNKDNSIWENTINVQNEILNNLEHKCFDGVEVIREYAKINSLGLKAAMPIVFTSMLFNDDESGWTRFGEMNEGVSQTSQVHLDYQALDIDGNLTIRWDYAQDIFEEKVIDSMFNHYVKALYKIAEGKENIKLELDKDELTSIKKYNETDVEIEENTLQELFKKQVQITPDSIAVKLEDKTIT
ncbi:MAG: AMP-binding protein, partial [Clostridium butyricum]|nr:AMP-binding protein [Clostridium butyricum]